MKKLVLVFVTVAVIASLAAQVGSQAPVASGTSVARPGYSVVPPDGDSVFVIPAGYFAVTDRYGDGVTEYDKCRPQLYRTEQEAELASRGFIPPK